MKTAKPCKDRFDDIVALVMGVLDSTTAQELQGHLAWCESCRATHDMLAEEEKEVRSGFEALVGRLEPVEKAMLSEVRRDPARADVSNNHFFERVKRMFVAHRRLGFVAAAAATSVAAGIVLYVALFSSSTAAYALDQTAEAQKHVTSFHVRVTPAPEGSLNEAWVELNPDGSVRQARLSFFDPHDGPKVTILSNDRAEVWFKTKHSHVVLGKLDRDMIEKLRKELLASRVFFDPKLAFEQLQADEKAGKVKVDTREPLKEGGPIEITVMSKDKPDRRTIFDVDPESKLVMQVSEWRREGERWRMTSFREYLDYNKTFDPQVFQFQLPKWVLTVNRVTATGLSQGTLSNDETAKKVAKDFFEAMIAGDYQKASPLFGGFPPEQLKRVFDQAKVKFIRVVEIGKPVRGKHPDKSALMVPVKVEMEESGKKVTKEMTPYVRPESGGRWTICGGI